KQVSCAFKPDQSGRQEDYEDASPFRRPVVSLWLGPRGGKRAVGRQELSLACTRIAAIDKGVIMPKEKNMSAHPSRRQILRSALVSSGLGLVIGYPPLTI